MRREIKMTREGATAVQKAEPIRSAGGLPIEEHRANFAVAR